MITTDIATTVLMIILIIITLFTVIYITIQNRVLQKQVMNAIEEAMYEYEDEISSRSVYPLSENKQEHYYDTLRMKLDERSKQEYINEHIDQVSEEFIELMKNDIDILEERYNGSDIKDPDNALDVFTEKDLEEDLSL